MTQLLLDQLVLDLPAQATTAPLRLSFESGQLWGVLGPNGVGKTTLLHTLGGLQTARSGTILLDNKLITQQPRSILAQRIGMMFQTHQDGFPATVYETVMLGRHPHLGVWRAEQAEDHDLVDNALQRLELKSLQQRLITQLSGGERQRVAMAMLMVQTPDIWLVDEPSNHLDLNHQVRVMGLLDEYAKQGDCVVASLHDVNIAAQWCSHVLLLYPDQPARWGKAQDLLTLENLEPLYRQSLSIGEIDGRTVFMPRH